MGEDREPLLTVTHARLRAAQGDTAGARRILEAILARSPGRPDAVELLASLSSRPQQVSSDPGEIARPAAPVPGEPSDLIARFRSELDGTGPSAAERIRRLEEWLAKVCPVRPS